THAPSGRRRNTGDEADDRLLRLARFQEISGFLLGRATNFTDHDDRLRLWIAQKHIEAIDEVGAVDRIATNADAGRLAEPDRGRLRHRLIGQRARARNDTDRTALVNVARHDADLALARCDDARTVRPDEPRLRPTQRALHLDHVGDRDAFGDAHCQP